MRSIFIILFLIFTATANAADGVTISRADGSSKTYSIEQLKGFVEIGEDFKPRILPAVASAFGIVAGFASATAAGATVPIIIITVVLDGFVYYFYGYGLTRFFDEMALEGIYKAQVKSAKSAMDAAAAAAQKQLKLIGI